MKKRKNKQESRTEFISVRIAGKKINMRVTPSIKKEFYRINLETGFSFTEIIMLNIKNFCGDVDFLKENKKPDIPVLAMEELHEAPAQEKNLEQEFVTKQDLIDTATTIKDYIDKKTRR